MQVETYVNSQNHFQVADVLILDMFYHTLFKYFTIYDFNVSLELWVRSWLKASGSKNFEIFRLFLLLDNLWMVR